MIGDDEDRIDTTRKLGTNPRNGQRDVSGAIKRSAKDIRVANNGHPSVDIASQVPKVDGTHQTSQRLTTGSQY
ncbi:unnamed protein product [Fusarium graminearum]|nr:unnamed protein product [Fusarium graminearum]CAG1975927.1 unnamed protein product [Fusarium graminearum]CAG2004398.1 unnamed protein product [Fusarium graminearum]VTO87569.1 unnamed protein product [Fusarium graminearum]